MRVQLAIVTLGLALSVCVVQQPVFASGGPDCGYYCSVGGDDQKDAIKGSLLIPAAGYRGQIRATVTDCDDCLWELSPVCKKGPTGGVGLCRGGMQPCPRPTLRMLINRLKPPATAWELIGSGCFAPGAPRTVEEITPKVRDKFIDLLPKQHPTFQPKTGGLVNLPVIFAAGQAGDLDHPTFDLAGFSVTLDVTATWTWDFDDGKPEKFTKPGGAYPNEDVSHTYTTTDDRSVHLTTTWDGTFTVDDLGPYDITGAAVTQVSAGIDVPIHQAPGQLVGG